MKIVDISILGAYFLLTFIVGYAFKDRIKNTSDYFRGGGQMLWWMVGATAYMNQFSAWVFTGGVGSAYQFGFQIVFLYFADALSFYFSYRFTADRMRRMRVITTMEGIKRRYGNFNEQFFTWAWVPLRIVSAGIWMSSLGIIISAAFGFDIIPTLIITGSVVLSMSLLGGAWAVVASDFIQMLIVFCVSIVVFVVVLIKGNGPINIINNFPAESFFYGDNYNYIGLFFLWVILTFTRQIMPNNSITGSYRYLCAKDSANAKKAALIPTLGYLFGAATWFFPAWYAASEYPNLSTLYPSVNNASETAYLAVVQYGMPTGMLGLVIAAIFAATMSSMDTGLNQNTGIVIRSFYNPIIRKGKATDKELLHMSRILTIIFGVMIIAVALYINQLKSLTLFDLLLKTQSLLMMPIVIPLFFGIWIKKTPDWAGWATVILGAFVSYSSMIVAKLLPISLSLELSLREQKDFSVVTTTIMHLLITTGFYFFSTLLYKKENLSEKRQKEVDDLFKDFDTPVISNASDQEEVDHYQRRTLGIMVVCTGLAMSLLTFIPKIFFDQLIMFSCAGIMILIGALLLISARDKNIINK